LLLFFFAIPLRARVGGLGPEETLMATGRQ